MRLLNIDWLRPLAVLLIVVNHVFSVYAGVWESPWAFEDANVDIYKWIQRLSICCSLQLFTFISGYLYGFQLSQRGGGSFRQLVSKKANRLLFPYFFFGTIYYVMFNSMNNQLQIFDYLHNMFSGVGHLWFLPMLFCCFLLQWLIETIECILRNKYNFNPKFFVLFILILCYFVSPALPDVFCIKKVFMYLVFFYIGVRSYNAFCGSMSKLFLFSMLYAFLFVSFQLYTENKDSIGLYLIYKVLTLSTQYVGVFFFLTLADVYVRKKNALSKQYSALVSWSFGIYIYHQFIIAIIYYKTAIPNVFGVYWTPIVCLVLTILVSVMLSVLSSKTPLLKNIV